MTHGVKAIYLRSQGWKYRRLVNGMGPYYWHDPVHPNRCTTTETAYCIARKRQTQRERRRLKAAGYEFFHGRWWPHYFRQKYNPLSRQEAIQILDKEESKK